MGYNRKKAMVTETVLIAHMLSLCLLCVFPFVLPMIAVLFTLS
jgi:hypothetical protein